jgi:hypothetical protein
MLTTLVSVTLPGVELPDTSNPATALTKGIV